MPVLRSWGLAWWSLVGPQLAEEISIYNGLNAANGTKLRYHVSYDTKYSYESYNSVRVHEIVIRNTSNLSCLSIAVLLVVHPYQASHHMLNIKLDFDLRVITETIVTTIAQQFPLYSRQHNEVLINFPAVPQQSIH